MDALTRLFERACRNVTRSLIERWVPSDPGSAGYVSKWTEILEQRRFPGEWDFEVSETIGLTTWGDEIDEGFSRFRSLTGSVALFGIVHEQAVDDDIMDCVLCRLLFDSLVLQDVEQLEILNFALIDARPAFSANKGFLCELHSTWAYFAELLIAALMSGELEVEAAAVRLFADEKASLQLLDDEPMDQALLGLFGDTRRGLLHGLWADLATWCLAPFTHLDSIAGLLQNLQPWRWMSFGDEAFDGLTSEQLLRLREIEAVPGARSVKTRRRPLPLLSGKLRRAFC